MPKEAESDRNIRSAIVWSRGFRDSRRMTASLTPPYFHFSFLYLCPLKPPQLVDTSIYAASSRYDADPFATRGAAQFSHATLVWKY